MLTANEIIDRLGGTSAVSKPLGLTPSTVHSWRVSNHIPAWRQPAILALAMDKRVELSTTDFPQAEARLSRSAA